MIDLESDCGVTTEVYDGVAGLDREGSGDRGWRGYHSVDVTCAVAQCHLVVVGAGEKFGHQGVRRVGTLGVDIDDRWPQFGVLEGQHPRHSAKFRLRQRDPVIGLQLRGAASDKPQPGTVPGAGL